MLTNLDFLYSSASSFRLFRPLAPLSFFFKKKEQSVLWPKKHFMTDTSLRDKLNGTVKKITN